MSQDTERLIEGLERVFDAPAPPTSVDAADLVERGHHLLRRRRTAGALSAVAIAVVALLTAAALPGLGARTAQVGATGTGAPLLNPPRFGWLPGTPDAFVYEVGPGTSSVTAVWENTPVSPDSPKLTLISASQNPQAPGDVTVVPVFSGDQPVQVGVLGDSPVWYYSGTVTFSPGGVSRDALVWKTASGSWAVLEDPQVTGSSLLLDIASAANTAPTPLRVPLMLTGELATASIDGFTFVQTRKNDGLEYVVDANLGDENIAIMGIAGDTGLTTMGGTKCDFVAVSGLGTYQDACAEGAKMPYPTQTLTYVTFGPGTPFRSVSKVMNGVDVYVTDSVSQKYSQSLSTERLDEVTSFGSNSAGWPVENFGE